MDVDSISPISTCSSMDTEFPIPTTGHYPRDRFQCAMIAISNKLVIFGGHTLRQDDDDNNELFDYSINQTDIFHPAWCHWTSLEATSEAGPIYPADMSYGLFPNDVDHTNGSYKVFVVGQHKIFDGQSGQIDRVSSSSGGSFAERSEKSKSQADSYFSVPVDPKTKMHAAGTLATPNTLLNVDGQSEQLPILSEPSRWVKSPSNILPEEDSEAKPQSTMENKKPVKRDNPPIDTSATNRNDDINPSRKYRSKDEAAHDTEVRPTPESLSQEVKEMFRHEVDLAQTQRDPHEHIASDGRQMRISTNFESAPMPKPSSAPSSASSLYVPPHHPSPHHFSMGRRDGDEYSAGDSHRGSSGSGTSNQTGSGGLDPTSGDSTTTDGWYGKNTRKYSLESFCMLLSLNTDINL